MSRKRSHEDVSEDVFVYYENTELSSIPEDITSLRIHSSVRTIPPNAFTGRSSLVNVEYQEGLEVIGCDAFFKCQRLQKQQFPSTLIEIGPYAFSSCYKLEVVGSFPSSLKVIGGKAFYGCKKLQSIEIPNNTCTLQNDVFGWCENLTHARLPQGMVTIPPNLFNECQSLVDVNVPSSVIEIGGSAFSYCTSLATMKLPVGLKTIGSEAFRETGFKNFHFPSTVETIGERAPSYCGKLESVILPPKLETISTETFKYCSKLKDISIPKSVACVGIAAFIRCGLTQLDLSRCNLTSIGRRAFAHCSQLKNVLLPRTSLKRIEEGTFEDCSSLTHLWIPPTVEYIDNRAFVECTSLLSVEVPETLKGVRFVGSSEIDDEVCGYNSLVNFYLPPSHVLEFDPDDEDDDSDDDFMEEIKLGEGADGYPDLVSKLKQRFHYLPLHRACYFHSYHTLRDYIDSIQKITKADPAACSKVDFLGMTPLHILALSQRPWLDLFQELLSVSSVYIMRCRDIFGCTPLDYLCKNHSAKAVCVTKSLLPSILEPRMSFLGLNLWRDEVMSCLERVQVAGTTSLASEVESACENLEVYEWMEGVSLLESAVWKMKVEEEKATRKDTRESCRVNCGGSIVLANVMEFMIGPHHDLLGLSNFIFEDASYSFFKSMSFRFT
eukprot:CAMPEP_0113642502 /NCGR_PEP_ID=MMETSP0017_2-20120614/22329_1 /TAXON_ID=2856 /ORGANISM="Cylindrotheca closterium" /LENGTH=664 /DNA_ID=CAMNT_0000553931 /DNA_START=358 /DNA_END=2352 /DNA_ORIENTATION=+ /assembly_acc=CAM_ASM_000147